MQIYSTIFPVTDMLTQDTLIRLVIEWNQGSPYNKLSNLNWDGKSRNIKFEEENLSLEIQEIRAYNTIAIRFHQFDENNIIWNTDVVVNFDKHIFSIKLDRETTTETTGFIPKFKTPYLVNKLLDGGYVGKDNGMQISEQVIPVTRNNYHIIEDVICKQAVYNMPIVYVTKSWGKYPFEIQNLAYKLRGVAHVLGEEEADVSSILKTSCNGMNSHHGSVGIYYPGKTNVHKIITTSKYVDKGDILIDRIVRIVCRYVNQQARDTMMTFEGVQNELFRLQYEKAAEKRIKAESEVAEGYDTFSTELCDKERTIEELNTRIMALQAENQGLRAKYDQSAETPLLYYGEEDELFEGEIKEHILEMLRNQLTCVKKDTRKEHILIDILESNESTGVLDEKRAEIKRILKGYTKAGDNLKRALKSYGFAITNDGGHYKLIYKDDPRYLYTMAASGSDSQRGGENLSAEIIRDML